VTRSSPTISRMASWSAGSESPVTRVELVATPDTIDAEMMAAVKTSYAMTGALDVDQDWAEGVASTLGWIRGVHRRPPLALLGIR
jgi:hypothetical protein